MADTVTYRPVTPLVCPQCQALWLFWPKEQSGLPHDSLNLRSPAACDYCENATADQLHRMERVGAKLEASHPVLEQQARALADAERRLRIVSDVSMLLHRVADVAWSALDNSEELKWPDCRVHAISGGHFDLLSDAFDALEDLPDDKHGCTLSPAGRALWMLQQNVGAWHSDDIAVFRFASAMREKMTKKRDEGYGGWNDKDQCPTERLQTMLDEHLAKGDPVDVANFAMMLWHRNAPTGPSMAEVIRMKDYGDHREKAGIAVTNAQAIAYRNLLYWVLYHHQGSSSHIGQPIRRALGIGQHDAMTDEQIWLGKCAGAPQRTAHEAQATHGVWVDGTEGGAT